MLWQPRIAELTTEGELTNNKHIVTPYQIVCSPMLFEEDNQLYLSYLGGIITDFSIQYNLIRSKYDITRNIVLDEVVLREHCFYGCTNNYYTISGQRRDTDIVVHDLDSNKFITINTPFDYIYRVVYTSDDSNTLLVTGDIRRKEYATYVYNIKDNKYIGEVTVQGNSIYKSTITNNLCVFSTKHGTGFEERHLIVTDQYKIV